MDLEFLTLKDVIESLTRYDVKHCPFPQNGWKKINHDGMIDDKKKVIYLDEEATLMGMRKAIIHEFVHAKYFRLGKKDTEKQVEKETEKVYKELYDEE